VNRRRNPDYCPSRAFHSSIGASLTPSTPAVFTWTRDAALTASGLLSQLSPIDDDSLTHDFPNRTLSFFVKYIDAQTVLQSLDTLSGSGLFLLFTSVVFLN
jgi:hypothetical protein